MKQIQNSVLSALTLAALLLLALPGCHSHEDSATMKEARTLNEETTEVGRKFHQRIDMIRERTCRRNWRATPVV